MSTAIEPLLGEVASFDQQTTTALGQVAAPEMFQQQILAWQRDTPTQEEVDDTLDGYVGLAQNPVVMH